MFTGTYFKLGRRRMAGGLEVRLGWSAVPVPVSQLPPEFLNRYYTSAGRLLRSSCASLFSVHASLHLIAVNFILR